jgi:hypothetical protein
MGIFHPFLMYMVMYSAGGSMDSTGGSMDSAGRTMDSARGDTA